ncbi:MAG: prenyltransferase/squalene oxidase repeat-containing protein [Pseudomonadota bacterium]
MASKINEELLTNAVLGLLSFLKAKTYHNIEITRLTRVLYVLLFCGAAKRSPFFGGILDDIIERQQPDGGWTDPEETAWAVGSIKLMQDLKDSSISSAIHWLDSVRHTGGGWRRHPRDRQRIPVTGLLLYLLPELSDERSVNWLKNEWRKDFEGATRLTYKGAFFLLGLSASRGAIDDCPLIEETYSFLHAEQNDDGGFGPWKDHPIGSDPWSTGIVLLGLLSYPELVKRDVIERAVNWLAENQLPNGLWAYHYIEEGSAYAYWGLVEALKFLSRESS